MALSISFFVFWWYWGYQGIKYSIPAHLMTKILKIPYLRMYSIDSFAYKVIQGALVFNRKSLERTLMSVYRGLVK
jgi:hypothetical protein